MSHALPGVLLSTRLSDPSTVPYFMWDEPMTVAELRRRLADGGPERHRLLGKVLREARDSDVWCFTSPAEVVAHWSSLRIHLGRRRAFWEFLLNRWRELNLLERQTSVGSIRIDPADEIFANKICALLGRAEIRDLVDVMALEEAGLSLQSAMTAAQRKDGGLTPAQLAWVLSAISIPVSSRVPGRASAVELDRYRQELIDRLVRMALPS